MFKPFELASTNSHAVDKWSNRLLIKSNGNTNVLPKLCNLCVVSIAMIDVDLPYMKISLFTEHVSEMHFETFLDIFVILYFRRGISLENNNLVKGCPLRHCYKQHNARVTRCDCSKRFYCLSYV